MTKMRIPLGQRLARYGTNLLRAPAVIAVLRRRFGAGLRPATIHRVALFPELGLAYNRVKKNANTTLTILLRELSGGEAVHRDLAKWEAPTPYDLPLSQLGQLRRLRWIVVVRNPYSRVLSAFLDKFREEKYRRTHGDFALTPDGFAGFVGWLEQGGLAKDGHWDLQSKLIVGPLDRFDAVIRFESLGADLEAALTAGGIAFDAARLRAAYPSDETKQTGAASRMDGFYDAALAARVAQLYAEDFTALGYATDYPGTLRA
ncbi:MAG: sulfotransferase family 2 domain-containing protein [Rhodobacteraceae bacterium]|nr:sulfotransferase family 2 domain-containing protein [Paracoccaceae bacterium]